MSLSLIKALFSANKRHAGMLLNRRAKSTPMLEYEESSASAKEGSDASGSDVQLRC